MVLGGSQAELVSRHSALDPREVALQPRFLVKIRKVGFHAGDKIVYQMQKSEIEDSPVRCFGKSHVLFARQLIRPVKQPIVRLPRLGVG